MKKVSIIIILSFISVILYAQQGTWSGKIEVQGMKLAVVFHIDEEGCSFDSPDQGVRGIPADFSSPDMKWKRSHSITVMPF